MWFYETLYPDLKSGIKGTLIHKTKTKYQDLRVYDAERFGRVMVLDGNTQTTELDEFIYHEMMTHPPLFAHPKPKNVLVIGAGDGGIVREVLKHPVKKVTMVEIDEGVIKAAKKYFRSIHRGVFKDERLELIIDDGAAFAANTKEKFDVIIVDSPDPVGPAKVLFSRKFYTNVFNALNEKGVLIRQTGSTMYQPKEIRENYKLLSKIFSFVGVHLIAVPTYVGGFFSLLIAFKGIDEKDLMLDTIARRFKRAKMKTKYYNPGIHQASTVLPAYLEDVVK